MAVTEIFTRIDSVQRLGEDFTPEFAMWLDNLVDTINQNYDQLDSALADIDARLTAGGL